MVVLALRLEFIFVYSRILGYLFGNIVESYFKQSFDFFWCADDSDSEHAADNEGQVWILNPNFKVL
jgi:hypothetical protein